MCRLFDNQQKKQWLAMLVAGLRLVWGEMEGLFLHAAVSSRGGENIVEATEVFLNFSVGVM